VAKHRLYIPNNLSANATLTLDAATIHYVLNVLRLRDNSDIEVFDGHGKSYSANLCIKGKRDAELVTSNEVFPSTESPLKIELLQVLSRGEKMDWTIQKAVELGVSSIRPLTSERCNVKLDAKRLQSRYQHWQGVINSACEQCGRNIVPKLKHLLDITELANENIIASDHQWLLHPEAEDSLTENKLAKIKSVGLLIGPEGGFSNNETHLLSQSGFKQKRFGPRILRTETAAIAAIAAIQSQWGDM